MHGPFQGAIAQNLYNRVRNLSPSKTSLPGIGRTPSRGVLPPAGLKPVEREMRRDRMSRVPFIFARCEYCWSPRVLESLTQTASLASTDSTVFSDFNSDGFAGLAIGVPLEDIGSASDAGSVSVLYGSAAGLQATSPDVQFWHQNRDETTLIWTRTTTSLPLWPRAPALSSSPRSPRHSRCRNIRRPCAGGTAIESGFIGRLATLPRALHAHGRGARPR